MTLGDQLATLGTAFRALSRIGTYTWAWLIAWVAAALVVFGAIAWALIAHDGELTATALGFFLPDDWVAAGELLIDRFLADQARGVLASAIVGTSLAVVSLLLFPLKERISATFEVEAQLDDGPPGELPLWRQAVEEGELFVLYLALMLSVFWVGYSPEPWRQGLATALSHLILAATWGIDFVSPALQRRQGRYAEILRVLGRHAPLTLTFGALLAAPSVAVGHLLLADPDASLRGVLVGTFAVQIVTIATAVLVGTGVGVGLRPALAQTSRTPLVIRALATLLIIAFVAGNGLVFGRLAHAAWGISAVLRCEYTVDWEGAELVTPSLERLRAGVRADIIVHNPTARDLAVRDHRIEVLHDGELVTTTTLPPLAVPAGGEGRLPLALELELELDGDPGAWLDGAVDVLRRAWDLGVDGALAAGRSALDPSRYDVILVVETELVDFPVRILTRERR